MKSIEEIKEDLKNQSFEDVYSENFSGIIFDEHEWTRFAQVFDPTQEETEYQSNKKFKRLIEDVEILTIDYLKINQEIDTTRFPSFIELYLFDFYEKETGLSKYGIDYCPPYALQKDYDFNFDPVDYRDIVSIYEDKLVKSKWFSKSDELIWINFKSKRERAVLYEKEIIEFREELHDYFREYGWPFGTDLHNSYSKDLESIINKHYYRVKNRILELKLIKENPEMIETLEILSELILNKKSSYDFRDIETNQRTSENDSIPLNIQDQEKFVYCHKFGIISYLQDHIKSNGSKYTDVKLYDYLSLITGVKVKTIKRLMTFSNTPSNSDVTNPFNKTGLMERVNRIITNTNMIAKD